MDTKKLVTLRKEAEKVIAEMPDGDLKVKAFEVVLEHLLNSSAPMRRTAVEADQEETGPKPSRKTTAAKSASARILVLKEEGFFKNQRSMGEVSGELAAHGWHYPLTALSGTLQSLTQRREIRRVRSKKGNKTVWLYSEP